MFILTFQRLLLDAVLDIAYFPLWWYSAGLRRVLFGCGNMVAAGNAALSTGLWLKNIMVPMFGQYDWQGRLTSFFMRLVNVIGRSIGLFVWIIIVFFLFLFWLALPLFIMYMMFISLFRVAV